MGRPLRQDTIEAMGLVASGKTLSKQVGYNKYKVKDSEDEIVMLAETENLDSGEVVLSLTDGVKSKPVLKIMKHLFQTSDEAYVYELNAEGKPVFEKEGVSISVSSAVESKPSAEPKVLAEPKSKSKSKSEPKSEPEPKVLAEPSTEADSE